MDRDRIRIMETLETTCHSDTYIAYGCLWAYHPVSQLCQLRGWEMGSQATLIAAQQATLEAGTLSKKDRASCH